MVKETCVSGSASTLGYFLVGQYTENMDHQLVGLV